MTGEPPSIADIEAQCEVLRSTLEQFEGIMGSADEKALREPPDEGAWSARDLLSHLLACQDVWSYSIYAMLLKEGAELPGFHPNAWMRLMDYQALLFQDIYAAFRMRRMDFLRILENRQEQDWMRSAVIGGRELTAFHQLRRMATHEQGHWEQIRSFLR